MSKVVEALLARTRPVFYPDGGIFCYTDSRSSPPKKKREIEKVNKRLQLTPEFSHLKAAPWNRELWQRACWVCGTPSKLTVHHVVPISYKKWFIDWNKPANKALLCRTCHSIYEKKATTFKLELDDRDIKNRSAVLHVLIEALRLKEEGQPITHLIDKARAISGINITEGKIYSVMHKLVKGRVPVNNLIDPQFEVLWREHFLKEARPQFLPSWWKADMGSLAVSHWLGGIYIEEQEI